VQLLKLFTEIMNLAHARGSTLVSEKAVEFLLKDKSLADMTKDGVKVKVGDMIRDSATFALPVAVEAQDAAIAAIATLGKQHEILRPAALQALESLMLVNARRAGGVGTVSSRRRIAHRASALGCQRLGTGARDQRFAGRVRPRKPSAPPAASARPMACGRRGAVPSPPEEAERRSPECRPSLPNSSAPPWGWGNCR
jgi:hypothetical protein